MLLHQTKYLIILVKLLSPSLFWFLVNSVLPMVLLLLNLKLNFSKTTPFSKPNLLMVMVVTLKSMFARFLKISTKFNQLLLEMNLLLLVKWFSIVSFSPSSSLITIGKFFRWINSTLCILARSNKNPCFEVASRRCYSSTNSRRRKIEMFLVLVMLLYICLIILMNKMF